MIIFFLKKLLPKYIITKLRQFLTKLKLLPGSSIIEERFNNEEDLIKYLESKNLSKKFSYKDKKSVAVVNIEKEIKKNEGYKALFKNDLKDRFLERESFLCHALTLFPHKNIKVLDIGGGFKPCHFILNYSLPKKIITTHVVELEYVVEGAKQIYKNEEKLIYFSSIPKNENYDVIYFGSSIQYFLDLNLLFNKLPGNAKIIAISYTSFVENLKSFVAGQKTMNNKYINSMKVYNIKEFIEFFSNKNFELIHKSPMSTTFNFGGIHNRNYNLVFKNINITL